MLAPQAVASQSSIISKIFPTFKTIETISEENACAVSRHGLRLQLVIYIRFKRFRKSWTPFWVERIHRVSSCITIKVNSKGIGFLKCCFKGMKPWKSSSHMWWQTFHPFCPSPGTPLIPSWSPSWKVQKGPQQRLLNLMDSFRLSSWPHCWWWLLLRAVMASLMDPICLPLIRNASQSPQQPYNHHQHAEQSKGLDLTVTRLFQDKCFKRALSCFHIKSLY